ncbi:hypothetical protein [Niallia sp. RD1]|uniref:hypothetical protein n=1 Tax=Niallia sp. RD1 TaxID=2962858 RepID=UPI0020C1940C|nr:hypothetical protein [Niallia sp. RD1]UTI41077.1 hypothetical protein NKG37_19770 [Niallia sp. RD1]
MREGDWVVVDGKIEFIHRCTDTWATIGSYAKDITTGEYVVNHKAAKRIDEVQPAPLELEKSDIIAMIGLAIDTNDTEWFLSLKKQLDTVMQGV